MPHTKIDFRSLPSEVRADRRKLAFRKLDDGWDIDQVAELVEVHSKTVEEWIRCRSTIENNNYHGVKRGREKDVQKYLTKEQEEAMIEAITHSTPDKEGVAYFLWSRKAIREVLTHKYKVTLAMQTISDYIKRWGLSSQRPKKYASEQDEKKIQEWLETTYPAIQKQAKTEGAEIHWGDETNLNINTNYERTYAPKGKTPQVSIPARKTSVSLMSTVTNQGKLRYMVYTGGMNTTLFLVFLKRLVKDTDKKVYLILDNLRVHHAKKVTAWAKKHTDSISIFFPTSVRTTVQS